MNSRFVGTTAERVESHDYFPTQLPLFGGLFQTCYVSLDLDGGVHALAEKHGISRFRIKRNVPAMPGMPVMQIREAHVFIGAMQIELMKRAGRSRQRT